MHLESGVQPHPAAPAETQRRALIQLALAALGLSIVAAFYLAVTDLPSHWRAARWDLNALGPWWLVAIGYSGAILVALGCYLMAWRAAMRLTATRRRVLLVCSVPVAVSAILLLTYPVFSRDVFYSITGGRILSLYQENPYVVAPARFTMDPFFHYTDWRNLTMPYGPLWTTLAGIITEPFGSGVIENLLLFKSLAVAGFLASTFFLGLLLQRVQPRMLLPGLVLWSWNPLVLLETAGNAHNGIVMIAFILAGLYLAASGHRVSSILALTLAVALKYAAIVVLPVVAIYLVRDYPSWRQKIRVLMPSGLVSGLALFLLYAPFWAGWGTLGFVKEADVYYGTPLAIARYVLVEFGGSQQDWILKALVVLIAAAVFPWLLREASTSTIGMLRASYGALMLAFTLWTYFAPWYVIWTIAIAASLSSRGVTRQAVALTAVAAASYLFQYSLRHAVHLPVVFWSTLTAVTVFGTLAYCIVQPRVHLILAWQRLAFARALGPSQAEPTSRQ